MTTPFPFQTGATLLASQLNAITTLPINDQTASYVALVGDVGKRIVMNVATANTVTINNTVFATGDTIFIANKGAGATTVTAGAGVTINTAGSLVIAQHGGGTLVATSASVFTFFPSGGIGYGVATGGTSSNITVSSQAYTLLQFTSSSTLTVTKAGLFDVLMFGGGAGGGLGSDGNNRGGGGGAGGILQTTVYLTANQTVTIGGGGSGATGSAGIGNCTTIGAARGLSISGGGPGGFNGAGLVGASGGGGSRVPADGRASTAPGVSGFAGGNGDNVLPPQCGGGGGATAVGAVGTGATGGAGGAGFDVSAFIAGSALFKGGGGGGAGTTGGAGGSSVGGAGGSGAGVGGTAAANTGSGGGGSGTSNAAGGAGGSGIVYVRFQV